MEQKILTIDNNYQQLDEYLQDSGLHTILLVCDSSLPFLQISRYFETVEERLGVRVVEFNGFKPNPLYESVVEGVNVFRDNKCESIIVVGGGSAMDVAKCIKLYSNMNRNENYLKQTIVPNDIKLLAVPTTAGTGSEATRYAVIYYKGEKQSVTDYSCIPDTVLMDPSVLMTLSEYQKRSTMMDAFCHAIESFWSLNSTEESKKYSRQAIQMIMANKDAYLINDEDANFDMLRAAHMAGKAINIAQTTAGHAMCYKLTGLYGVAHGHAAALCVRKLWPYMMSCIEKCIDPRGEEYLRSVFDEIASAMDCDNAQNAIDIFNEMFDSFFSVPKATEHDYRVLRTAVNHVRLMNNPVILDEGSIDKLYHKILK